MERMKRLDVCHRSIASYTGETARCSASSLVPPLRAIGGNLHSIRATTVDPNTLMTINADNSRSDTLLNIQALQIKSVNTETVTPAAQASASRRASVSIARHFHRRELGANADANSIRGR